MTRLLLIGLAGVDWPSLQAQLRRGVLPSLAALAARGGQGWLRSTPPRQGPAAWTSVATGHRPEVHRVIRDEEAWAGGLRPLSLASWRRTPVWQTLQDDGVATASVAWPGVRPGAAQLGLHIDEDFTRATGASSELWSLPRLCAPPDAREALRDARTHPTDITATMLRPLVPAIAELDQSRDTALPRLAVAMARAATAQAAAAWVLEDGGADAVFVHHAWLGEVRDAFDGATTGPFAGVVDAAWRFLDGLVGRLAELAGPDGLVLIAAPGRRTNPGALVAAGPGVAAGARLSGADVLDLAPTVLARFGLEDATLPGAPVAQIVASGPHRTVKPAEPASPIKPDRASLAAAVDAGHAQPSPAPGPWLAQGLAELAAAVVERDPHAASALAAEALTHHPEHALALGIKSMAHVALGEPDPLPDLGDTLMRVAPELGWGALAKAVYYLLTGLPDAASPWLRRAELDKRPEMLQRIATIWLAAGRGREAERLYKAVIAQTPGDAAAHLGVGMAAVSRLDFRAAEAALRTAVQLDPGFPSPYLQLAHVYARTGRAKDAARMADAAGALGAAHSDVDAARHGRLGS